MAFSVGTRAEKELRGRSDIIIGGKWGFEWWVMNVKVRGSTSSIEVFLMEIIKERIKQGGGLRIRKAIMESLRLRVGEEVRLSVEGGKRNC